MEQPKRIGSKWLPEEDNDLLQQISDNIPLAIIALIHRRSLSSIRARMQKLSRNMVPLWEVEEKTRLNIHDINFILTQFTIKNNKTVEEIAHRTGLTIDDINFIVNQYLHSDVPELRLFVNQIHKILLNSHPCGPFPCFSTSQ
jgi:hypothetical protein